MGEEWGGRVKECGWGWGMACEIVKGGSGKVNMYTKKKGKVK